MGQFLPSLEQIPGNPAGHASISHVFILDTGATFTTGYENDIRTLYRDKPPVHQLSIRTLSASAAINVRRGWFLTMETHRHMWGGGWYSAGAMERRNLRGVWLRPMERYLRSHGSCGVHRHTYMPINNRPIGSKWVFKMQTNSNGSMRHMARLVIKCSMHRTGGKYIHRWQAHQAQISCKSCCRLRTHDRLLEYHDGIPKHPHRRPRAIYRDLQ